MDTEKAQQATIYGGPPDLIIDATIVGPGIVGPYACVVVVTNDGKKHNVSYFDDSKISPSPSDFIGKKLIDVIGVTMDK